MTAVAASAGIYLERRCACRHRPPLRLLAVSRIEVYVAGTTALPEPDEPFLSYRCHRCREVITLSLRDLLLTERGVTDQAAV